MSTLRKFLLLVFVIGCFVQGDPVSYVLTDSWVPQAQALIGRPATPFQRRRCGTAHDAALRGWRVSLLMIARVGGTARHAWSVGPATTSVMLQKMH